MAEGKSASGDMHLPVIEINLHNITRYQKQRLYFHLTAKFAKVNHVVNLKVKKENSKHLY